MLNNSIIVDEYAPDILIMRWQANAQTSDVLSAFEELKYFLDQGHQQNISIILDMTAQPNNALNQTMLDALNIHQHTNFGEWLILGSNQINAIDNKIRWFGSLDDLNQYLPCFAPTKFVSQIINSTSQQDNLPAMV